MVEKKKTIEVVEEQLDIHKAVVSTGSVHVRKRIEEHVQSVTVPLSKQSFTVERIEKNHFVDTAPEAVSHQPGRTIISVVEERIVVEKRLFLVEEIHIVENNETSVYHDDVTLKREVIDVERKPVDKT